MNREIDPGVLQLQHPSGKIGDRVAEPSQFSRVVGCVLLTIILALMAGFVAWIALRLAEFPEVDHFVRDVVRPVYWLELSSLRFWWSPLVMVVFPLILLASVAWPADRSQRVFSRALFQDMTWSFAKTTIVVLLLAAYLRFLTDVFDQYFQWMIFRGTDLPTFWRNVLVILAADFLYWLRHVMLHKIPAFWYFHAIHHSQTQLNPFTIYRVHPVELMISLSIWFIPMYALTTSLGTVLGYYIVRQGYDAFVHANIRTNLGPFRFVFVTPQSHRVHHSGETEHYDRNFGAMLSVWDHLFQTQYRNYDVYPVTGIPDKRFPNERAGSNLIVTLDRQLLYPFGVFRELRVGRFFRRAEVSLLRGLRSKNL